MEAECHPESFGFPVAGFSDWRFLLVASDAGKVDKKAKAFGNQRIETQFEGYLIDGQQRLTSLEAAFGLFTGEDKRGDALRCYLDLGARDDGERRITPLFVTYASNKSVKRRVDEADSTLVPLNKLLDGQNHDLREETKDALRSRGWTAKRLEVALKRFDGACEMLDQLVPRTTVSEISDKDAIEVFKEAQQGRDPAERGRCPSR